MSPCTLLTILTGLVCALVAWKIFALTWVSRKQLTEGVFPILGPAYAAVGLLDLLYALVSGGLDVAPGARMDLALQLWVAARLVDGGALLLATGLLGRTVRFWRALLASAAACALLGGAVFGGFFPVCFRGGTGPTAFKVGAEAAVCVAVAGSMALLWRRRERLDPATRWLLLAAMATMVAAGLSLTVHDGTDDLAHAVGHGLKVVAWVLLFRALVVDAIRRPGETLYRSLRESEERLRTLGDNLPDSALVQYVTGPDGEIRILHLSAGFERVTGLPAEEVLRDARSLLERVPRDDLARLLTVATGTAGGSADHALELRSMQPDGTARWIRGSFRSEPLPGGSTRWDGVLTDVTGRRRLEEEQALARTRLEAANAQLVEARQAAERNADDLRRALERQQAAERRYRHLVENAGEGVWVLGVDRRTTYASERMASLLGTTPAEMLGTELSDFWFLEDVEAHAGEVGDRMRSGLPAQSEVRLRRKDGEPLWVLINNAAVEDEAGRPAGMVGLMTDISRRKRAEAELEESKRQVEADLAAMTLLHGIGAEFVREGELEPVLDRVVETAVALAGAVAGSLQMLDGDGEGLRVAAQRGLPDCWVARLDASRGSTGSCGAVLDSRERVVVEDVEASPLFAGPGLEACRQAGVRAVTSTPLTSLSGAVIGILCVHFAGPRRPAERELRLLDLLARQTADMVERVEAGKALASSEARYRALFERARDAKLIVVPPAWGIASANPAAVAMFRARDEADLLSRHPSELSPARQPGGRLSAELSAEVIASAMADGSVAFEWTHRRLDGEEFPATVLLSRVEIAGQPVVQGAIRDVTRERRAAAALRESEERFHQMAAAINDGFWIASADGAQLHYVSPGIERLWGITREEMLSDPSRWMAPIHPDDLPQVFRSLELVRRGEPYEIEYRLARPDGTACWISDRGYPIRDAAGVLTGAAGVCTDVTARRQVEVALRELNATLERRIEERTEELRASEALHRSLVEASPYGIALVDLNGRCEAVNEALVNLLGAPSREALLGIPLEQTVPPEERKLFEALLTRPGEVGHATTIEGRVLRWDGTTVPAELTGTHVRNPDGTPRAFLGMAHDITHRKRAEAALREAKESLERRVAERTAELTRLTRVLTAGRRSDQALLRAVDERTFLEEVCRIVVEECGHDLVWIGFAEADERKSVTIAAFAGDRGEFVAGLDVTWAENDRGLGPTGRAIRSGRPMLSQDLRSDPSFVPWRQRALDHGLLSSSALPLMRDGRAFGAMSIYSTSAGAFPPEEVRLLGKLADDLAIGIAAVRLQRALGESESRFRTLAEASFEGISVSEDGVITDANERLCEITGLSRAELVGTGIASLLVVPEREGAIARIRSGVETSSEHVLVRPDGSRVTVEVHGRTIARGDRMVRLTALRDVTERKRVMEELGRAKEAAEAASRAKSTFLASMSHELRTPLNAVIGFSELLDQQFFGPLNEKQKEFVVDIAESGRHLLLLLNDILDLVKIEAAGVEPEWTAVDVEPFLVLGLKRIRPACEERQIRLDLDVSPQVRGLALVADGRRLKQVLLKLLSNAVKFTPDGGWVRVGARLLDGARPELEVSVADSGVGLAPEDLERVFGAFHQVQSGLTGKTPGAGLGLSLVRQLVTLHGGRVWAESEGPGKGSRFTFVVPVDATAAGDGGEGSCQLAGAGSPAEGA